jgi:hypothetical protein
MSITLASAALASQRGGSSARTIALARADTLIPFDRDAVAHSRTSRGLAWIRT